MSPKDIINCEISPNTLTVGQKISLTCKTDGLTIAPDGVIQFGNLEPKPNHEIEFLGLPQKSQNSISQTVTSYKVGDHEFGLLKLTVGSQEFLISKQVIKVESVLKASEKPGTTTGTAEPTPFPIFDPMQVAVPWWWWTLWGVLLAIVITFITYKFLQWKKGRLALKVAGQESVLLTPAEKFRQGLRRIESQGFHQRGEYKVFALELTTILKSALASQLKFHAEDMTSEEINSEIERRHKTFYKKTGTEVAGILADLDQIKFAKVETDAGNCIVLLDRAMKIGQVLFEVTS